MRRAVREEDAEKFSGSVLQAAPAGEYDRREVLLTREAGRIACFARRARRQGNPLMAATSPFAFGLFRVIRGRSADVLLDAEISNYFEPLRRDPEAAAFGCYFLEICEFITRENNDEASLLLLLYVSLLALEKETIPNRLVRAVFEIRTIVTEGEYPGLTAEEEQHLSTDALRAHAFLTQAPLQRLYTFAVSEQVLQQLEWLAARKCRTYFRHDFPSLRVLETLMRDSCTGDNVRI